MEIFALREQAIPIDVPTIKFEACRLRPEMDMFIALVLIHLNETQKNHAQRLKIS